MLICSKLFIIYQHMHK